MKTEEIIRELITAAVDAVRPENFIPEVIRLEGDRLFIRDDCFSLDRFAHIYIAAVGKAAFGMTEVLDRIIHPYVTEGIVLTKYLPADRSLGDPYRLMRGGHPVPTEESAAGAGAILRMLDKAGEDDLVIFLISGGGSALMTAPVDGLSLDELQTLSADILGCGADIREFNIIRKHLDGVKGGRLSRHAAPARQVTVILSDVVGSSPDVIASGPTVPDPSCYADALDILDRYAGRLTVSPKVRNTLERGKAGLIPETLKPGDPAFASAEICIAAENRTAAYAAARKAEDLGLRAQVLTTRLTGEASAVGALLPAFFSEMEAPGLLVLGGETTVVLKGSGFGGRNLETALAAVRPMASCPGCILVTLATDGDDGNSGAAGAVVTSETLSRALEKGLVPEAFLAENDSRSFFAPLDSLLIPGPTGTNVNDLVFLLKV